MQFTLKEINDKNKNFKGESRELKNDYGDYQWQIDGKNPVDIID